MQSATHPTDLCRFPVAQIYCTVCIELSQRGSWGSKVCHFRSDFQNRSIAGGAI
jgi:hypothetical protein